MTTVALRSARERAIQVLWFEGLGLAVVAPLYGWVMDAGVSESLALLAALSLAVTLWAALFNAAFDWCEWRWVRRVASDRPQRWRVLHAALFEATAAVVTCPVIMLLTGLPWWQALLLDAALSATYAVYGYLFHLAFDRLRPVAL